MRNRYACTDDLNNYFKKKDLLSGLTTLELAQLRRNIGITEYTGEGGQDSPVTLTYSEFWERLSASSLITGAIYCIKDFLTVYSSNTYNSGGYLVSWGLNTNPSLIYKLYVRAISNNLIDTKAIIEGKNWEVRYDPTRKILQDGTFTKGTITYLKDDNGNSAYYDFKNIRWKWDIQTLRQYGINSETSLDLYTFSEVVNGQVSDSSELHNTKHNTLLMGCYNNVFIGDTYYNILEPECINNLFAKGAHDNFIKWNSTNNRFAEPVCYIIGSIYDKNFNIGDTTLSSSISKTIHKVNEATIVSFLDPTTYAYQIIKI